MNDIIKITGRERLYPQIVKELLGTNLIVYFPARESSGTIAFDRSGNRRNGAYGGSYSLGAVGMDELRTAVDLQRTGGINAYSAGLATAFDSQKGTVGGWFKMSDPTYWTDGTNMNVLGFGADSNNRVLMRASGSGEAANFQAYYVAGGSLKAVTTNPMCGTRWVHLALSWDKVGDVLYLYINGARSAAASGLGVWSGALASNFAYFGATQALGSPFGGRLAHAFLTSNAVAYPTMRKLAQTVGVVCFEGDSRTAIKSWPFPAVEGAYPMGSVAFGGLGVTTMAVSGSGQTEINARAAITDSHLVPGGKNVLVFWAGINSQALGTNIYEAEVAYLQARKAAGWKIVWCTEIDGNSGNWHTTLQAALNRKIYANHTVADALVDLGADARLQNYANSTYYLDGVHLTSAGYAVVQELVMAGLAGI